MKSTILCLFVLLGLSVCFETPHRVLKENMPPILFINGEMTSRHRGAPIPQMVCKRGDGSLARTALCEVAGGTGDDVIFKCQMELPNGLKLGKFEVGCEGWSGPDDNYWATGTCQLEYEIVGAPVHTQPTQQTSQTTTIKTTTTYDRDDEFFGFLFFFLMMFLIISIVGGLLCIDRNSTTHVVHSVPARPPPATSFAADYYEPAFCYNVPRRSRHFYMCRHHSDLDSCTYCFWDPIPIHRRPVTTTTTTTTVINNNKTTTASTPAPQSAPATTISSSFGKSKTRGSGDEGSSSSSSSWSGWGGGGSSGGGSSSSKSSGYGKSKTR